MVRKKVLIFALILPALICPCCYSAQKGKNRNLGNPPLDVKHSQNTTVVPMYEVFEITFKHENKPARKSAGGYENPFFDVTIEVIFTSPSKKQIRVGGFHYGSSTGAIRQKSDVRSQMSDYLSSVLCWPAVGSSYIRADFGELSRAEQISQYTCPISAMRQIPNSLSPDKSGLERKIGMTNRESRPSDGWGEYP